MDTFLARLFFAEVDRVYDGDTLSVSISGKKKIIRLESIDCPEDGQPWSERATSGLIRLLGSGSILLDVSQESDVFGRTVATIFCRKNDKLINLNEEMVKFGNAWVYRKYYHHLSVERKIRLDDLESWAKSNRVGLWKNDNAIAPWLWRKWA